jgi:acyl-[acyl-carrier-protein]-phospholipid O-acyltransferase/long-chain-fatty-acid--[acyl-carrier-protein] ligase
LRSYLKKCPPEDFARTDAVIGGAEKLPRSLVEAWEKKFGHRPVEGYGTTELSPVVGVNVPSTRQHDDFQPSLKEGTIGRALPNMAVKVIDVETGESLPPNTPGMLMVKGPCVMKEYLNQPERTAEVLQDGWYRTGDVAQIDEEGFISITGRMTRISKIGGEMVPHVLIEEEIYRIAQAGQEEPEKPMFAVAGVPDEKKGEKLVVLHTEIQMSPEQICKKLSERGLPTLWLPAPSSFRQVEEIPVLGTGKLDIKVVQEMTRDLFEIDEI